jgi:hypothetical protein
LSKKLLRDPIAMSRARSVLAYLSDMSRPSLRGSSHSGHSLRFFWQPVGSQCRSEGVHSLFKGGIEKGCFVLNCCYGVI